MRVREFDFSIVLRLALPLLFLLAVGIAPIPIRLSQTLQQARQAQLSGEYIHAAESLARLAQDQPWRVNLWEEAGRSALNGGDISKAISYFEQAQATNNLSPGGLVLLGDAYQFFGDSKQANEIWVELLNNQSAPASGIYLRLADNQRLNGDYEGAIQSLRTLIQIDPGQTGATYQLGLLLAASNPEAALPYLEQASELDPSLEERSRQLIETIRSARFDDDPAYSLLESGRALASLQEWKLADLAFQQATTLRPDYAEAWAYRGHAQERLGESGDEALNKALSLNADSISVNLFAALHYAEMGNPAMALVYLHNAAKINPQIPEIQLELGNILAEMSDLISARRHIQRAFDLAGKNSQIYQSIAESALRYNIDIHELALPSARQAVLLAPNDPKALDMLGQVYFKMDYPSIARRFFMRALQQDSGYAPAHLHMGMVFLLEDEGQQAQDRFKLVQSLAPNTPSAEQAARLLGKSTP